MTRNRAGFLYAVCLIAFGLAMGAWHWLLTGITKDFGAGVAVGAFIGAGVIFLASRKARESD